MGDFGIAGLWLRLAMVLIVRCWSGSGACCWRIAPPQTGCRRAQFDAVAVPDLRGARVRPSRRIHRRRRLGALLLR